MCKSSGEIAVAGDSEVGVGDSKGEEDDADPDADADAERGMRSMAGEQEARASEACSAGQERGTRAEGVRGARSGRVLGEKSSDGRESECART